MFAKPKPAHLAQGDRAEEIACHYLSQQGLQLVTRNFRCQQGEIDLIMRDGDSLVIIEVRFRQSAKFGGAIESITHKKQSRIIAATQYYLLTQPIDCPIRFDVVAMSSHTDINWIKNAFQT